MINSFLASHDIEPELWVRRKKKLEMECWLHDLTSFLTVVVISSLILQELLRGISTNKSWVGETDWSPDSTEVEVNRFVTCLGRVSPSLLGEHLIRCGVWVSNLQVLLFEGSLSLSCSPCLLHMEKSIGGISTFPHHDPYAINRCGERISAHTNNIYDYIKFPRTGMITFVLLLSSKISKKYTFQDWGRVLHIVPPWPYVG